MTRREMLRVLAALGLVAAGPMRSVRGRTPVPSSAPGASPMPVPPPAAFVRTSWSTDPWALGSYSFLPVGAHPAHRRALATPVDGRLSFAGEATSVADPSTVHGALGSGWRAAGQVRRLARPGERIGVVGAGIAGLACARDLADAGFEVVVLEARDTVGGRLDTVQPPGWPIPVERGASWIHVPRVSDLASRLAAPGRGDGAVRLVPDDPPRPRRLGRRASVGHARTGPRRGP